MAVVDMKSLRETQGPVRERSRTSTQDMVARTAHVLLRVVAGGLILQHGGQKLFGWFAGPGAPAGPLPTLMMVAGVIEFLGGIAVLLGLFTRPVAFLLSGELAVAYFTAHQPHGAWPIQNHGELAALYSFVFLFLAANGSGGTSLDRHPRRESL